MNFDAEIKVLNDERKQLQLKAQELTNFENRLQEKQSEIEKMKLQIEQEQAHVSNCKLSIISIITVTVQAKIVSCVHSFCNPRNLQRFLII